MNVAFDKPLNRSDQPQPIIKLDLIQTEEKRTGGGKRNKSGRNGK